jgi:hypothetical protein
LTGQVALLHPSAGAAALLEMYRDWIPVFAKSRQQTVVD